MAEVIDVLFNARANFSAVISDVKSLQSQFQNLALPKGIGDNLEKSFGKLTPLIKEYQKQLEKGAKGFTSQKDLNNFNALRDKIDSVFSEINNEFNNINSKTLRPKVDIQNLEKLSGEYEKLGVKLSKAQENLSKSFSDKKGIVQANLGKLDQALNTSIYRLGDKKDLAIRLKATIDKKDFVSFDSEIKKFSDGFLKLNNTAKIDFAKQLGFSKIGNDANQAQIKVLKFLESLRVGKSSVEEIERIKQAMSDVKTEMTQVETASYKNGAKIFEGGVESLEAMKSSLNEVHAGAETAAQGFISMNQQLSELQSSTQYFFSLRNMINLFERGVRHAVDTVKELDAAMTETAVVTDFSVSDMWNKLPEYTANANKLGATIQDMYKSTTLYYQQGLNSNQAMSIAAETMKMARIAGLDAKDATDMMTAALRGFNMQIDETSAKRINDVYSKLAAITASDTEELGSAMQRTASIAANAGMTFEGTTAFLAQAIETTREPAENIGTAMKTIIARMQEMKKNPMEIGEVEGEEVSYNKIDEALKSVGISLKEANGDFKDNDKVLLEISQRWDSLTQTQQRYIATTVAGSRQQSRFIAMVSDYERTMQLMEAANNSEGASDEQFGKTMESLEAKLNKLKNAWDQFLMGISNNVLIKGAVDGLTNLVTGANKLIDTLSNGNGLVESVLSLGAAFIGLKAGGRIVNQLIGGLGGLIDPTSNFRQGWRLGGIKQRDNAAQAKTIYEPIVQAVNRVYSAISGKDIGDKKDKNIIASKEDFLNARQNLKRQLGIDTNNASGIGEHSIETLNKNLEGLDNRQRHNILQQLPGLGNALGAGIKFNGEKLSSEAREAGEEIALSIQEGVASKEMRPDQALQVLGDKNELKRSFGHMYSDAILDEIIGQRTYEQAYQELYKKRHDEIVKQAIKDGKDAASAESTARSKASREAKEKLGLQEHKRTGKDRSSIWDETINNGGNFKVAYSELNQLEDKVGSVGDKFVSTGESIYQFGNILSNLGLEGIGNSLMTIGDSIAGIGEISAYAGEAIDSLGKMATAGGFGSISAMLAPVIPLILGAVAAFGTMGAAIAYDAKKIKDINSAAAEVTENFNKVNEETQKSISSLQNYKGEFEYLAKGVDEFGNNINLDPSEFERYNSIVEEIAAINPSIVEGYNAQGHAIINNNKALENTLALQKQIQKQAVAKYTSVASLDKLIESRNNNKDFSRTGTKFEGGQLGDPRISAALSYVRALDEANISKDVFEKFGLNAEALKRGNKDELIRLSENIDQLSTYVGNLNLQDASVTKLSKAAVNLQDTVTNFNKAIEPTYKSLSTYANENKLTNGMTPELVQSYQKGLQKIASSKKTGIQMQQAAQKLSDKIAVVIGDDTPYAAAIRKIEQAKEKYANNLNIEEYLKTINSDEIAGTLQGITNDLKNSADETDRIIAETAANALAQARNLEDTGLANLNEAFDTVAKHIKVVQQAAEDFKDTADKLDPAAGTNSLKSIYDVVFGEDSIHNKGGGDAVYWKGVKSFISDELYRSGNKDTIDSVMKKVAPTLEEGAKGVIASRDFLLNGISRLEKIGLGGYFENENGELKIAKKIPEAVFNQIAEKGFKLNPDTLGAIMKRLDQFGLDFANYDQIRKAYASDERVYQGRTFNKNDQKALLISETEAFNDAIAGGKTPAEFYSEVIPELKKQNVHVLETLKDDKSNKKEIADTLKEFNIGKDNYMQALNDLMFSKEDIKAIGEELFKDDTESQEWNDKWADLISSKNDPIGTETNDKLGTIIGILDSLAIKLGADPLSTGKGTKEDFLGKDFKKLLTDPNGALKNFTQGKDANGKKWETSEDFNKSQDYINDYLLKPLDDYKTKLETGRKEVTDPKVAKKYDKEIADVEHYIDAISIAVGQGQKYFNANRYNGNNYNGTVATGFGNTDFYNRPTINWGNVSKKSKNFKAAKEWLGENPEGISTYISSGETFKDNKGEYTIAFTPMINEDGKPKVLTKKEVGNYLNEIIGQSLDENGNIDFDSLYANDYNGIIMGSSRGGADSSAARLGEVEEYFSTMMANFRDLDESLYGFDFQSLLGSLSPELIANSPELTEALGHLCTDVVNGSLPTEADLKALGIFDQYKNLGGQVLEEVESGTEAALNTNADRDAYYSRNTTKAKEWVSNLLKKFNEAFETAGEEGALGGYAGGAVSDKIKESIRSRVTQIFDGITEVFNSFGKGNEFNASKITQPFTKTISSIIDNIKHLFSSSSVAPNTNGTTIPGVGFVPKEASTPTMPENSKSNFEIEVNGIEKLEKAKQTATETQSVINEGATFKIKTPGVGNLTKAAKAAKTASQNSGKNLSFDAKVSGTDDTKKWNKAVKEANGLNSHSVKLKATASGASDVRDLTSAVQAFHNLSDKTVTNKTINWTVNKTTEEARGGFITGGKTLYRSKGGSIFQKKGTDIVPAMLTPGEYVVKRKAVKQFGVEFMQQLNHGDLTGALKSLGSAADGRHGRLGPNGKGGLTLTGEKGFEIAWLPSESRSVILGSKGPQLTSLPSDAVVYTHEQSKKIVKQKAIPAGSHATPGGKTDLSSLTGSNKSSRGSKGSKGGGGNKTAKRNEENSKKTKKIIEKAGKINAWWWNMTKKVEATQRKIDQGAKRVSEILKKVGTLISDVKETVNGYAKVLRTQIQLNTRMSNKANKKLETLDTAKKSSATKKAETAVSKAQKKLNKAKNKKDKKEAKKQLTKAKNKLRKTQKGVNYSTISYDVTQVETDKKGKKKKSKKTKKQRINLAPFITYDEETGAYTIDYNKINKKYGKNKSKAKAVMEAAEKKLEDYQGKKNTAEDNIEKANEALNQLGQDLYDAIYGWEVELTKIWNITQQIEETTGRIERLTSFIDLMDAQVASGMAEVNADFIKEYTDTFRNKLEADIKKLEQQMQLIDFGKIELQDLLDVNTNADAISNIGAINKATEDQIEQVNETKNKYESKKDTAAAKKATKEAAYKELQDAKAKLNKLKNAKKKDKKAIAAAQKEVEKKRAAYNKTKDPYTTAVKEKETAKSNYDTATNTWKEGIEAGTLFDEYDYALNKKYVEELETDQKVRQLAQGLTKITTNDDGTVSVDFNADEFLRARKNGKFDDGTVLNGETANRIQEYVKSIVDKVNELNNAYVEATNLIAEQYQQLAELKDNWANYGEQLLSYAEEQQSEKIDELKALADSIDKSLKDLLDKVRQDLDRRRQQEDNAKTERNISKKQQRLATLRSNTGGGNQVEIARLQEEIAEEQMNYQRTLEDQLLERLNDQADLAAKQRERQIQLEEAILQATNNAALVNKWMDDPERYKDEIQAAFYDNNKYNELTAAQQAKLDDEFKELYTGLLTNHDKQEAVKEAIAENEKWLIKIKESLSDLAKALNQTPTTPTEDEGDDDDRDNDDDNPDPTPNTPNMANWEDSVRYYASQKHYQDRAKTSELFSWGSNHYGLTAGQIMQAIADTSQATWEDAINAARKLYSDDKVKQILMDLWGTNITNARKKGWEAVFGKIYTSTGTAAFMKRYASGGIATQTGPAWLDGTPAKPELVLSPTDTKNFIALKDVLSHVMGSTNSLSNVYGGDASYEININVDHINSDYDVDRIAARVEKKIVNSANYRNVTQVRKFR